MMILSWNTFGQASEPPMPPGALIQTNHQIVKVVKPKQGTGNFAAWCPQCDTLEIVKAIKIQTNGGRIEGSLSIAELKVTAKCPNTKKTFEFSAERTYQVKPKAVEVDANPDK